MKIDQFERNVMTSPGTTTQFGANMNGVAFSILSKSIYEHPIAAIIRETVSNADDSHTEAGIPETPIVITLPNKVAPNFSVEDFGVGLDDTGVREVFSTYFGSTKTDDNTQKGGFGLGSKTPFSYSETFMVRARKDSVQRTYTAFIGRDGMPEINLIRECHTEEPNGVMVQVPVQEKDFSRFKAETKAIVSGMKVLPLVYGVSSFTPDSVDLHEQLESKGWADIFFTESSLYSSGAYVLMGGVFYRLPDSIRHDMDEYVFHMSNGPWGSVVFPFDIGELNPAASRETLSLEDHHIDLIVEKTNAIIEQEKKNKQAEINACSNKLDALKCVKSSFSLMKFFDYKGESLWKVYNQEIDIPYRSVFRAVDLRNRNKVSLKRMLSHYSFSKKGEYISNSIKNFYGIYSESKVNRATLEKNLRKYVEFSLTGTTPHIVVIFETPMSETKRNRVDAILGRPLTWLSYEEMKATIPEKERASVSKIDRGTSTAKTIFAKQITSHGNTGYAYNIEINDDLTYYYVDFSDDVVITPEMIGEDVRVLVRNKQNTKKMERFGILPYNEVQKEFAEAHKKQAEKHIIRRNLSISKGETLSFTDWFNRDKKLFSILIENGAKHVAELYEVFDEVKKDEEDRLTTNQCNLVFSLIDSQNVNAKTREYEEKMSVVKNRYKLLADILESSYTTSTETIKHLIFLLEKEMGSGLDFSLAA